MPCSLQLDKERNASSTPESEAGVLVVHRHHLIVRCSHWLVLRSVVSSPVLSWVKKSVPSRFLSPSSDSLKESFAGEHNYYFRIL